MDYVVVSSNIIRWLVDVRGKTGETYEVGED